MRWFRKRTKEIAPVCVHDWHLLDTDKDEVCNGIDVDFLKRYQVGCIKCNKTKVMDELQFAHFERVFDVGNT
jgi:hypothetical protein